ncbi:hypothetical protein SCP_0305320 [Sparassis crispa]|uniref:F-box domain-containing protein n=1 Tax=Sparassis crispa TaxID=139825 RepID=A0A401GF62_9APHY|nr:hypothetical protein SCP_0305320 [Sparassis crispa]GBE80812.1 hypothetical protein SCP_0305320 [Sparassis crispa]
MTDWPSRGPFVLHLRRLEVAWLSVYEGAAAHVQGLLRTAGRNMEHLALTIDEVPPHRKDLYADILDLSCNPRLVSLHLKSVLISQENSMDWVTTILSKITSVHSRLQRIHFSVRMQRIEPSVHMQPEQLDRQLARVAEGRPHLVVTFILRWRSQNLTGWDP